MEKASPDNREMRRLVWWNRFWLGLLLLATMAWGANTLLDRARAGVRELRVRWDDGGLNLTSASDGPFVVTHLVRIGTATEAEKAVADLPTPIAIIDSGGAYIKREAYRKLTWRNFLGDPVPSPPEGAPIRALYYRPLATPPANGTQ
jgi:hypothetical protein